MNSGLEYQRLPDNDLLIAIKHRRVPAPSMPIGTFPRTRVRDALPAITSRGRGPLHRVQSRYRANNRAIMRDKKSPESARIFPQCCVTRRQNRRHVRGAPRRLRGSSDWHVACAVANATNRQLRRAISRPRMRWIFV